MSFPVSPSDGQIAIVNGVTYRYSSTKGAWAKVLTFTMSTSNATVIANGNAATSTTSGALVVTGGVGIGGNLWSGSSIYTTNGVYWAGNGVAWSSSAGAGGGGGTVPSRTTVTYNTTSIAAGGYSTVSVSGFKGYNLYAIESNVAAWVTVYANVASQTADLSRFITTDPAPGTGVIAEAITSGAQKVWFTPGAVGFSAESTPDTNIPLKIYNNGISTTGIQIKLTLLQTES